MNCQPFHSPGAQPALGGGQAPRTGHQQRPGQIGGGVVQHTRRVGRHHAGVRAGSEVDVVVTDGEVADALSCGAAAITSGVIGSVAGRQRADLVRQARLEAFDAEHGRPDCRRPRNARRKRSRTSETLHVQRESFMFAAQFP
jgi:hypothetical protein